MLKERQLPKHYVPIFSSVVSFKYTLLDDASSQEVDKLLATAKQG